MTRSVLLEKIGMTESDLFFQLLASMFIVDFGIVKAVGTGTVDVEHAIQPFRGSVQLGITVTEGVQILWPASSGFSEQGKLAIGDTVLLIGLKDYVKDVSSGIPGKTDIGLHYSQETMKAIPLGVYKSGATHTVDASGTVMKIDGGTKGAARQDDATVANATTDAAFWIWLAAVGTGSGAGAPPSSMTGKVNAGSAKVEIG